MKGWSKFLFIIGLGLVISSALWLIPGASPASAQCGADASSCKRCHQGQNEYPVNELGAWHIDHADSDFCQICHGGDKESDDAAVAHEGMFEPLGERGSARCKACHPADAGQRVEQYVDLLANYDPSAAQGDADAAPAAAETGYDWRNITLAGVAGFLTMLSAVVVWNTEHLGEKFHRTGEEDTDA